MQGNDWPLPDESHRERRIKRAREGGCLTRGKRPIMKSGMGGFSGDDYGDYTDYLVMASSKMAKSGIRQNCATFERILAGPAAEAESTVWAARIFAVESKSSLQCQKLFPLHNALELVYLLRRSTRKSLRRLVLD